MNNLYSKALENWCASTGDLFLNPNSHIQSVLDLRPHKDYLTDWIHPNGIKGVALYSEAVLKS